MLKGGAGTFSKYKCTFVSILPSSCALRMAGTAVTALTTKNPNARKPKQAQKEYQEALRSGIATGMTH
jgi:hypothetical protein